MSTRWLVERSRDSFEDCGYEHVRVEGGALVFRDGPFEPSAYILAAGEWLSVVREDNA